MALLIGLQRIDIKKTVACEADAGQRVVEQRNFGNIEISGVTASEKHPLIKENVAHGGTGFTVGGFVRQFICRSEAFD